MTVSVSTRSGFGGLPNANSVPGVAAESPVTCVAFAPSVPSVSADHAEPFHTLPMNVAGSALASRSELGKLNVALHVAPVALAGASDQRRLSERDGSIVDVPRFGWSPAVVVAVRLKPAPAPEPAIAIGAYVAASPTSSVFENAPVA